MSEKTYAVNICDWMVHKDDFGLQLLLKPVTKNEPDQVVECESGRIDGMSLRLLCDQERAAAIVKIIRVNYQKHQLRIYHGHGLTWKRV